MLGPTRTAFMHHLGIVFDHKMPQKENTAWHLKTESIFMWKEKQFYPSLTADSVFQGFATVPSCLPVYLLPRRVTVRVAYCFLSIFFSFVKRTSLWLDKGKKSIALHKWQGSKKTIPNPPERSLWINITAWHGGAFVLLQTNCHWKNPRNV